MNTKAKRYYSSKSKSISEIKNIPNYCENMNYVDCDLDFNLNINQELIDRIQQQINLLKICDSLNIDVDEPCEEMSICTDNISINTDTKAYIPSSQDMLMTTDIQPKYKIGDKVKIRTYYMSSCTSIPLKEYETTSYHFYTIIDILYMNNNFLYVLMYDNNEENLRDYYKNGLTSKLIYQKFENDLFRL
jgi:hypothetical protein